MLVLLLICYVSKLKSILLARLGCIVGIYLVGINSYPRWVVRLCFKSLYPSCYYELTSIKYITCYIFGLIIDVGLFWVNNYTNWVVLKLVLAH